MTTHIAGHEGVGIVVAGVLSSYSILIDFYKRCIYLKTKKNWGCSWA